MASIVGRGVHVGRRLEGRGDDRDRSLDRVRVECTADQSGLAHWVEQLEAGDLTRSEVAAHFYASPESRERRVTQLYLAILGRAPDAGGLAYWSERLLTEDDVRLAVQLASSSEVYGISQAG